MNTHQDTQSFTKIWPTEKRQRGSGVKYKACLQLNGCPKRSMIFDRESNAMRWADDTGHALIHNIPLPWEGLPLDGKSIAAAVSDPANSETLQKRFMHTIDNDRQSGKRLINRFGKTSLRKLIREDIELYKGDHLQRVGSSSVRRDMSMLSRLCGMTRIRSKMEGLHFPEKYSPLAPAEPMSDRPRRNRANRILSQ